MDPNFQDILGWLRSPGIPTLATVIVYLDLKARVKRLEERTNDYGAFNERLRLVELSQAKLEGRTEPK